MDLSPEAVEELGEEKRKQLRDKLYREVDELNTFLRKDCPVEEMGTVMHKRQEMATLIQALLTPEDMDKMVEEWGYPEEDPECYWS